jgi:ADP-ribosyl-[dinitrogen reductase] hydrolase
MDIGDFTPLTDMVGGGCFELTPGEWTDDTSLAYGLAMGIIESPDQNPETLKKSIATFFARWLIEGYASCKEEAFDIGNTCNEAIEHYAITGEVKGLIAEWSQGNGGIMRQAPAVIAHANNLEEAVKLSVLQNNITHAHPVCQDTAAYMAYLHWHILNGATIEQIITPRGPDKTFIDTRNWTAPMMKIINGDFLKLQASDITNDAWCIGTLESALWGLANMQDFREMTLKIANFAGDADTVGAVFGQLAGGIVGLEGLPQDWLAKIAKKDELLDLAKRLFENTQAKEQ